MSDDQPTPTAPIEYTEEQVVALLKVFGSFGDAMQKISLVTRQAAQEADEVMQEWWNGLDPDTKAIVQALAEEQGRPEGTRG